MPCFFQVAWQSGLAIWFLFWCNKDFVLLEEMRVLALYVVPTAITPTGALGTSLQNFMRVYVQTSYLGFASMGGKGSGVGAVIADISRLNGRPLSCFFAKPAIFYWDILCTCCSEITSLLVLSLEYTMAKENLRIALCVLLGHRQQLESVLFLQFVFSRGGTNTNIQKNGEKYISTSPSPCISHLIPAIQISMF